MKNVKLKYIKLKEQYQHQQLYHVGYNDYHGRLVSHTKTDASPFDNSFLGKLELWAQILSLKIRRIDFEIVNVKEEETLDFLYNIENDSLCRLFKYYELPGTKITLLEVIYIENFKLELIDK